MCGNNVVRSLKEMIVVEDVLNILKLHAHKKWSENYNEINIIKLCFNV